MSLVRNFATVGGATLLSRLLGFVRDVLLAAPAPEAAPAVTRNPDAIRVVPAWWEAPTDSFVRPRDRG